MRKPDRPSEKYIQGKGHPQQAKDKKFSATAVTQRQWPVKDAQKGSSPQGPKHGQSGNQQQGYSNERLSEGNNSKALPRRTEDNIDEFINAIDNPKQAVGLGQEAQGNSQATIVQQVLEKKQGSRNYDQGFELRGQYNAMDKNAQR